MIIIEKHTDLLCSGIYLITNLVSKKQYVGSSNCIYHRLKRHSSDLNRNRHGNLHLQNAWNKYGKNAFEAKLIERCEQEVLEEREQIWMDKLSPEYNKRQAFRTGPSNNEINKRISETLKKKYATGEIVAYRQNHKWKKVSIYDSKGKFIEELESPSACARKYGISKSMVLSCIYNKRNTKFILRKYQMYYTEDVISGKVKLAERYMPPNGRIVKVIDIKNNIEKIFYSIDDAAQYIGRSKSTLKKIANKNRVTETGYKIEYVTKK